MKENLSTLNHQTLQIPVRHFYKSNPGQYIFNEYQLNQIRKKAYSSLEFFKNNIQNVIGDLFLEISDIMENI